jgi:hypothetical protein
MRNARSSRIMARTTLNIDTPVLDELRQLQTKTQKSLGRLVSDLLNQALAVQRKCENVSPTLEWISKPMGSRLDLEDKEAVLAVLDRDRS